MALMGWCITRTSRKLASQQPFRPAEGSRVPAPPAPLEGKVWLDLLPQPHPLVSHLGPASMQEELISNEFWFSAGDHVEKFSPFSLGASNLYRLSLIRKKVANNQTPDSSIQ